MHRIDNIPIVEGPASTPTQAQLPTPTTDSAGRSITVIGEEKMERPSLLSLSPSSMIFRFLQLRDIYNIGLTCKRLQAAVREDNALAKAWYRQFSSAHQYQLRMSITAKDRNQIRDWLNPFTEDKALVESMANIRLESVHSPALLYFVRARLMSQCETFNLNTEATIHENNFINSAALSVDGRHLVTTNENHKAIIYGQEAIGGSWVIKTSIRNHSRVKPPTFSPDGQHLLSISCDLTVKIYSLGSDKSWALTVSLPHDGIVQSATFSSDGCHVITVCRDDTAKIHSRMDDGSWAVTATLSHEYIDSDQLRTDNCDEISATFSTDGNHLVITWGKHTATIYNQKPDGSWELEGIIPHRATINSVSFSPNGHYVVTASEDRTAKIFGRDSNGLWVEIANLDHEDSVNSATFSPDSRHMVTACDDGKVKIFYLNAHESWKENAIFKHYYSVFSATFGPDGHHIVTASEDCTAKVIGQATDGTWSEKASINHDDWVNTATFSADNRYVVTASWDGSVQITELQSNHFHPETDSNPNIS
ncbi:MULTISPECIES: F-box/WD40 repeat-containing protein [unclassified Endozoicomonas]|uniref:F-box/WD repeat-containing protein n=1 Tax=unclassified Endozoicomonas TaxID=2644528 RepID=UPI0021494359|nr:MULTISPECIES: F-box/WD40 repeat-containing protein [unclassified Endozoicomonas]